MVYPVGRDVHSEPCFMAGVCFWFENLKGWYLKRAPHSLQIAICRRNLSYHYLTAQNIAV